jgi:hypothetical protein
MTVHGVPLVAIREEQFYVLRIHEKHARKGLQSISGCPVG